MREQVTELQKLKLKHGETLSRLTNGLVKYATGAIVGSVVTAGFYSGAIDPAKFLMTPAIGQGEIIKVNTAIGEDPSAGPLIKSRTSDANDLTRPTPISGKRPLKLDLDLDSALPEQKVFLLDASTMELADAVNDRANDELNAINVIRKAIDEADGFSDPMIKGSAKADAIVDALDLARVSKNMEAAAYDDHVFKIASGLPRTFLFNEIVETLNWKRQTVRNAIDVTTQLADAMRAENDASTLVLLVKLTGIMDNYEMATKIERTADALTKELESQSSDAPAPQDGTAVPGLRGASADPMEKLKGHFGTAVAAPTRAMAL
ncbi:hypothetical protein HFN89_04745 [Rhizobium laguerreae]|nr:hypothetical protein [Rhizobium laguerreae]